MSLATRITEANNHSTGGLPCSIGALLGTLDKSETAALNTMLYDLGWSAGQVWEALRDEGYVVGRQSVNRHRGKRCRCVRDADK